MKKTKVKSRKVKSRKVKSRVNKRNKSKNYSTVGILGGILGASVIGGPNIKKIYNNISDDVFVNQNKVKNFYRKCLEENRDKFISDINSLSN